MPTFVFAQRAALLATAVTLNDVAFASMTNATTSLRSVAQSTSEPPAEGPFVLFNSSWQYFVIFWSCLAAAAVVLAAVVSVIVAFGRCFRKPVAQDPKSTVSIEMVASTRPANALEFNEPDKVNGTKSFNL